MKKKINFNCFETSFVIPSKLVFNFSGSPDSTFSALSKKPDAEKQYKSMLEWADGAEKDLLGNTDYEIALNAMHEYKLVDDETFKLATIFLTRKDGDYGKMYNGVVLDIPDLEQGTNTFTRVLQNWIDGLKGGDLTDPKFALGVVKRDWKAGVQPVRARMGQIVKMALKKQAYFGTKGVGQISDRLLKELDGTYKGFRKGVKYRGWLMEGSEKLLNYLKGRLEDRFNIDTYSTASLGNFMKEMPELTENGDLNLDVVFKSKYVSGIYVDLIKEYSFYLRHFLGEKSKGERGEISEAIPLTGKEKRLFQDETLRLEDAKQNLVNFGFTLENGKILDENGNELPGAKTNYQKAIVRLSEMIDNKGYDETMDRYKKFERQVAEAKMDLGEYGWSFDDDAGVIYSEDGNELDLKGYDYDEAVAEINSKIMEHGYEEVMRELEKGHLRKGKA